MKDQLLHELLDYMGKRLVEQDKQLNEIYDCIPCNDFYCLSHKHKNRIDEAFCSAKFQLADKQSIILAQRDALKARENFINCQLNEICDLHEALAKERQK
jgi:hypothetical protein